MDFLESMRKLFGDRLLSDIDAGLVEDYRLPQGAALNERSGPQSQRSYRQS